MSFLIENECILVILDKNNQNKTENRFSQEQMQIV